MDKKELNKERATLIKAVLEYKNTKELLKRLLSILSFAKYTKPIMNRKVQNIFRRFFK